MSQPQLLQMALDPRDVVYTPDWVARDMVEYFKPTGRILEPCAGDGAFLRYLPTAEWCEIEKGRDFYTCSDSYDWIFGNPPYADFSGWLEHSFVIARDIVYLIPLNKPFNSSRILKFTHSWGGIKQMRYYGSGAELGFPIGFAIGAIHYQRDYRGPMEMSFYDAGAL